jgi:hypothetical protein
MKKKIAMETFSLSSLCGEKEMCDLSMNGWDNYYMFCGSLSRNNGEKKLIEHAI